MKQKTPKKLSFKKITILNFEEASSVIGGGTNDEACPYTTAADNCSSKPGRPDSCEQCNTYALDTCAISCLGSVVGGCCP
jgi:hypothetical protein